jgi:hypothetical protein
MGIRCWKPRIKRPGREADHSSPSSVVIKNGGAMPPHSIRLHGVVLNSLRTGTYLPSFFTLRHWLRICKGRQIIDWRNYYERLSCSNGDKARHHVCTTYENPRISFRPIRVGVRDFCKSPYSCRMSVCLSTRTNELLPVLIKRPMFLIAVI